MDAYSQDQRLLQIDTVLGQDHVLLVSVEGEDRISSLFCYELELASTDPDLQPDDLLGSPATVWLNGSDHGRNAVNGIISRFGIVGHENHGLYVYRARLVPTLWLLTRTSDCRIFQDQNVRQIIEAVLAEYGITQREWKLRGEHDARNYCVQYSETAYDFICRLLEEEGIAFYFKHTAQTNTVVFSDNNDGFVTGDSKVPIVVNQELANGLWQWEKTYRFRTGQWALSDFNFETPSTSLATQQKTINPVLGKRSLEKFEYPGRFTAKGPGSAFTKLRIEYEEAAYQEIAGQGSRPDFAAGICFGLVNSDKADAGKQFLITAIRHTAQDWSLLSQDASPSYTNSFRCVPEAVPYRPEIKTPRPRIHGTQTAIVTGPSGSEICTDQYGRIKVQFHWDRYGKNNDHSSCWIRVAQTWAGKGWGGWYVPRMGQEVVVTFLDGDPDRPLVVGSVYNAEQTVPFALPANATQSGVRTRSSLGGSAANCNELRFEDKKGSEEVNFHAERDLDSSVEHNETRSVGNDQTIEVGHDRSLTVGHDETTAIGDNRTETVGSNETVTIGKTRSHTIGMIDNLTVAAARFHTVGAAEVISVGAAQTISVGAVQSTTVGASQSTTVGANRSVTVGSNQSISVGSNETYAIAKDSATSVGGSASLSVAKSLTINAGDEIVLQTGSATITMKKNGDITIEGKAITIKGSGDVVIKGQKILQN
jgi:type VI secretion system secreted protein VgrG